MNWTAQDEAKWAELDARRTDVMRAREKARLTLLTVADKIVWEKQGGIVNKLIRHAAELRDALEPYDDRVSKQECSQSNQADDGWIMVTGGMNTPTGRVRAKILWSNVEFEGLGEYIDWSQISAYRPVK